MPITTPIYNEMERQNARAAARQPAGFVEPAAAPEETGRSFGFRSGATRVGGTADQHLATATAAGASLGEPTSFRAGAGAPTPVGVIRGTRQTFATETGGPQLEEFATPLAARQASNRFQSGEAEVTAGRRGFTDPTIAARFGGFRPAGQTIEEVKASKEGPGATAFRQAQAGALTEQTAEAARKSAAAVTKENVANFEKGFLRQYGVHTPKEKGAGLESVMPKDVNAGDYQRAADIAQTQGHEAGIKHYEESQTARKWLKTQPLQGDVDIDKALNLAGSDPALWQELMSRVNAAGVGAAPVKAPRWWETPAQQQGQLGVSPLWNKILPRTAEETPPPF